MVNLLEQLGYSVVTEVGRKIIQEEILRNGTALPWKNKVAFRDAMIDGEIKNFKAQDNSVLTFFDRSIIDVYGYSKLEQIAVTDLLLKCCDELTYHKKVFIFPPWAAIYENDIERKQDFTQAVATYHEMKDAYEEFGYELIDVPKTSAPERAKFILENLNNC